MRQTDADRRAYRVIVASPESETPGRRFAQAIRAARARRGWTQDDLIEETGLGRATLLRWEAGDVSRPEPEKVRRVFRALGIDPREAPVLLGFVTREEMGLPAEPPRLFSASVEEVIAILEDPGVPEDQKREWVEYLRFRTQRGREQRGHRRAG